MSEEPTYQVFVSYARADRKLATAVSDSLGRQGWSVFMDREIPNAAPWREYLEKELARARCVVVLWSAAASTSEWVAREVELVRSRGVVVYATLDGTAPPLSVAHLQATSLSDWDGSSGHRDFVELMRAVAAKVGTQRALGTLAEPQSYERITEDHLALTSTSWKHGRSDRGPYPYQIHVRLVGKEAALRRIENVVYYFDPAYGQNRPDGVDSVLRAYVHVRTDWRDGFTVYELANGYSVVRAAVKVRDQASIVELSRIVDMLERGPRLAELYPVASSEGG